ncbi:hypothetical protein ABTK78_20670, partial [Acinetobacter baumannii]
LRKPGRRGARLIQSPLRDDRVRLRSPIFRPRDKRMSRCGLASSERGQYGSGKYRGRSGTADDE